MARKKINDKTHRVHLALSEEDHEKFKIVAKNNGVSVAQLCRTLIEQTHDKSINDTAKTIQNLTQVIDERLLEFAKANDVATSFLINNLSNLYEFKLEKLQKKVDAMAPYLEEANKIIAAREAVLRKKRASKRAISTQPLQQ